jgi:hypothetical protein
MAEIRMDGPWFGRTAEFVAAMVTRALVVTETRGTSTVRNLHG